MLVLLLPLHVLLSNLFCCCSVLYEHRMDSHGLPCPYVCINTECPFRLINKVCRLFPAPSPPLVRPLLFAFLTPSQTFSSCPAAFRVATPSLILLFVRSVCTLRPDSRLNHDMRVSSQGGLADCGLDWCGKSLLWSHTHTQCWGGRNIRRCVSENSSGISGVVEM